MPFANDYRYHFSKQKTPALNESGVIIRDIGPPLKNANRSN